MIGFMFLSISLLIIILWLITPALLGKRAINLDDADSQNTAIARERLAELELRLAQAEIDQQEFDETKIEIEKSLLQDIRDGEAKKVTSPKIERNAYVIITAIPLMALALYWLWGSPDSINLNANTAIATAQNTPQQGGGQAADGSNAKQPLGSVAEMAALLEAKLIKKPNNPNGWYTLGRTYMSLKEYDKAVVALRRLQKLVANDAIVMLTLADALTMSRNGRMQGEPFELIKQALKLKPNDLTALWMGGLAYEESGDLKTAVKLWKQLLPIISNEPRSVHQVQSLIVAAEKKMGLTPSIKITALPAMPEAASQQPATANTNTANATTAASIRVTVTLSAALKDKVAATDFVLVYARAASGPRMPLAIVRKQVKDLPMTITLDDSMAMQPTMKLSSFEKVMLFARVSKQGQAMPQSGDKQGQSGPIRVRDAKPVTVVIDKVLP